MDQAPIVAETPTLPAPPKKSFLSHLSVGQKFGLGLLLLIVIALPIAVLALSLKTNLSSRAATSSVPPIIVTSSLPAALVNTPYRFTISGQDTGNGSLKMFLTGLPDNFYLDPANQPNCLLVRQSTTTPTPPPPTPTQITATPTVTPKRGGKAKLIGELVLGDSTTSPTPTITPTPLISWSTSYASLILSSWQLEVSGRVFKFLPDPQTTTGVGANFRGANDLDLYISWTEQGLPMHFKVSFHKDGVSWNVSQMETGDGTSANGPLYFMNNDISYTRIPLVPPTSLIRQGAVIIQGYGGSSPSTLKLTNPVFSAFLNPAPSSTTTPSPTFTPTPIQILTLNCSVSGSFSSSGNYPLKVDLTNTFSNLSSQKYLNINVTNPTPSPIPTCTPRPGCLDQKPACKLPTPVGGWCPTKPTPTSSSRLRPTIAPTGRIQN